MARYTWRMMIRRGAALLLALNLVACATSQVTAPAPTLVATLPPPTRSANTLAPPAASTPTMAPEAEATALAEAAVASVAPELIETSPAPDGLASAELWRAPCALVSGFEVYGPIGYDEIRWVASPGSDPVVVDRQVWACQGLGAIGLRVLRWSPDSAWLFYTDTAQGSPDGAGCPWFGRVLRWSSTEPQATILGNGATSPDSAWVAGANAGMLEVWSWASGDVRRTALLEPEWPVSAIGWAPAGDRVLFIQSDGACSLGGSSVIGVLDVEAGVVVELLRTADPVLLTFRFESLDEITFYGASPDPVRYRLVTDQLIRMP